MREIKFRAWDKCNERMVEPRNILKICMSRLNQEPYLIVYLKKWMNENREIKESDKSYTNEFELMQYTGLKDKNGVEIYEGDVLLQKTTEEFKKYNPTVWEKTWEVVWGYHDIDPSSYPSIALGFHLKDVKSGMLKTIGDLEQDCLDNCYPYEVIGNIYENPELI